tara:strand:- start:1058 stop:1912 length:855 start_codon:yes stop_codon:yes gene_type:complete
MEDKIVYFGGAGYCASYYIGIIKCLREIFPNKKPIIHADSGGAIVALAYAIDVPNEMMIKIYGDLMAAQRKYGYRYGIRLDQHDHMRNTIRTVIKYGDFSKIQNNTKFNVGITSFFNNYTIYNNWQTTKELEHVLLKSIHIPLIHNKTYFSMELDGAYGSRSIKYDLTIGLNDGFDICIPTSTIEKLTVPTLQENNNMFDIGYYRTKDFFLQKDWDERKKTIPDTSFFELALMWFLKLLSLLMYIFYFFYDVVRVKTKRVIELFFISLLKKIEMPRKKSEFNKI